MALGHTINEELPVGGKVFLGGAGHQDFSPCSWLPAAEAKLWVFVVERQRTILCPVPTCGTEALPGCRAAGSTGE